MPTLWVRIIIFGVDMSSSVHIDNKEKDILILCIVPTKGIDDTTLTVKVQHSINFSRSNRKFCLSLYYNGSNSFCICYFYKNMSIQAKDTEIKKYPSCLGNILACLYLIK